METLPPEILEMIVQQLTPQDLARCSGVCHNWHEVFNQDWMWEPHCDPELVETLRTVPCVAEPGFEAPEGPLPVSDWKLAFMRETRYWKNWRRGEISFLHCHLGEYWKEQILNRNENIVQCKRENLIQVDFFTDNEVVVWCSNHIEVLDVGVKPASIVATTNTPIVISKEDLCQVIGNNMLLIEKVTSFLRGHAMISVHVFTVNRVKKSIKLKRRLTLNDFPNSIRLAKEHLYFHYCRVNSLGPKLLLYDLNTGALLKKESVPVNQNPRYIEYPMLRRIISMVTCSSISMDMDLNCMIRCTGIVSSPTSDFVAFGICNPSDDSFNYYIYSVKDLKFLQNVVAGTGTYCRAALNKSWLAIWDELTDTLKVVNLLSNEECSLPFRCFSIQECGDSFLISCEESRKIMLKRYNPSLKCLTSIFEISLKRCDIINNSFIAIFDLVNSNNLSESVWKLSGQDIKKWNIFAFSGCAINQTLTNAFSGCAINQTLTKMLIRNQHSQLQFMSSSEFYTLYLW